MQDFGSGEGVTDRPRTAEVLLRFAPFQSRRRKLRVRARSSLVIRETAGVPAGEIAFTTDEGTGVSAGGLVFTKGIVIRRETGNHFGGGTILGPSGSSLTFGGRST